MTTEQLAEQILMELIGIEADQLTTAEKNIKRTCERIIELAEKFRKENT